MENTTMFGGSLWIWVIFIGFTVISWLISHQLKSRFQKYSKIPTANGMTGRDVVEKMLRDNGVTGVKIGSVEGMLTDHYNPVNKTGKIIFGKTAENRQGQQKLFCANISYTLNRHSKYETTEREQTGTLSAVPACF